MLYRLSAETRNYGISFDENDSLCWKDLSRSDQRGIQIVALPCDYLVLSALDSSNAIRTSQDC